MNLFNVLMCSDASWYISFIYLSYFYQMVFKVSFSSHLFKRLALLSVTQALVP